MTSTHAYHENACSQRNWQGEMTEDNVGMSHLPLQCQHIRTEQVKCLPQSSQLKAFQNTLSHTEGSQQKHTTNILHPPPHTLGKHSYY